MYCNAGRFQGLGKVTALSCLNFFTHSGEQSADCRKNCMQAAGSPRPAAAPGPGGASPAAVSKENGERRHRSWLCGCGGPPATAGGADAPAAPSAAADQSRPSSSGQSLASNSSPSQGGGSRVRGLHILRVRNHAKTHFGFNVGGLVKVLNSVDGNPRTGPADNRYKSPFKTPYVWPKLKFARSPCSGHLQKPSCLQKSSCGCTALQN